MPPTQSLDPFPAQSTLKMLAEVVPLYVDGQSFSGDPAQIFECPCPFELGKTLYLVQGATPEDIDAVAESSFAAFKIWRKLSYLEKRRCFTAAAALLKERKPKFIDGLVEMGLPDWFANVNVDMCIGILEESASLASVPAGTIPQVGELKLALVVQEPIGPILSIVPWNSPGILCMRAVASPVLAGCSVILKSSELAPLISYEIAKLFADAGFPKGLVNVVHHLPQQAATITKLLIENDRVKKITFTGSTVVGRIIASTAANVLKPVLLELGGKCAAVVTSSADLEAAASAIVGGAFAHNGQICMSTERVFVVKEVYNEFLNKVLAVAKNTKGKPHPQRTAEFAKKIELLLKNAHAKGAQLLYGDIKRSDSYLEPVIFAQVDHGNDLRETESFGPTFYINQVDDVAEAIESVNHSAYGLSCGIWAHSDLEAIRIARELDTGAVHINGMTVHDEANLPHGGVKLSGYGRFNSVWGLNEFQYSKTITLN